MKTKDSIILLNARKFRGKGQSLLVNTGFSHPKYGKIALFGRLVIRMLRGGITVLRFIHILRQKPMVEVVFLSMVEPYREVQDALT